MKLFVLVRFSRNHANNLYNYCELISYDDNIALENDFVASQTSTVTNATIIATPTKTSAVSAPATTPRRFNVQQNQVESALNLQKETNDKLDKLASQNDEILVAMTKIILLLENISNKD